MNTPQYKDACDHPAESYVGSLGCLDVYIERTGSDFLICMRYGDDDSKYISGGAGGYEDASLLARTLINEHLMVMKENK